MLSTRVPALILAGGLAATALADDRRPDLVVADFEGPTYGARWRVSGTAFGTGPASGSLPGQMSVAGFEGRGLVNSFAGGDDAEGTLAGPPFRIERRYFNFLVGGGKFPGQTCVDLIVDGKAVRTATGPNDRPGGSERLAWATWDVGELAGQSATLRVVDARQGGWGHINLDQVVQSDARRQDEPTTRTIVAESRYLNFPVRVKNAVRRVQLTDGGGRVVREFDIRLDDGPGNILVEDRGVVRGPFTPPPLLSTGIDGPARPVEQAKDGQIVRTLDGRPVDGTADFMTWLDLAPFRGQTLTITVTLPPNSRALEGITLSDEVPGAKSLYTETQRPQFHFTSRRGWLNDPNGLVCHEGTYHLFYQHNPYGWEWGNMHWGHATSPDLVHWAEQPIALYPRQYGDWAFSGSAVVDRANTSGFGRNGEAPLVAAYTSTGRGECIVSSTDGGATWAEFAGNPVVRHDGRDPRLFWHEPTKRWIMAVYDETNKQQAIVFHSSPDLKVWTEEGRIADFFECPDLFELPVLGANPPRSLWVISAADGRYRLGQFDGHRFTPETGKLTLWHGDFYAAQTFSNTPDGRRIQVGWGRNIAFPGMPFNQQMTVPVELTLRSTPDGPRLCAEPVAELAGLRAGPGRILGPDPLKASNYLLATLPAETGLDVAIVAQVQAAGSFAVELFGAKVEYAAADQALDVAGLRVPLAAGPGSRLDLRILADRHSLEVFADGGRVAVSKRVDRAPGAAPLAALQAGDSPWIRSVWYSYLGSAWK